MTSQPLTPLRVNKPLEENTIDLKKAMDETNNWREFLKNEVRDYDVNTLSRGALIPLEDILEIAKKFSSRSEIQGIRAYFAIENYSYDPDKGSSLDYVKLLLVPVKKNPDFPNGEDMLFDTDDTVKEAPAKSAIYDFTMPCPDCCDVKSVLY
jgi:hypothetical protein